MKDLKYVVLLLAAVSVHLFVSGVLFKESILPKVHDERIRIVNFIRFDSLFFDKKVSLCNKLKAVLSLDQWSQGHPHFYETVGAFSWRAVSTFSANKEQSPLKLLAMTNAAVMLTNSFFLLVLVSSVYGIGALCFSRATGFLAALLVLLSPLVFGHSRIALLDYPLLCMTSLCMYLLLKAQRSRSIFFVMLCGASCALAQMTKETAFIFLGGPVLYCLSGQAIQGKNKKRLVLLVLCLALVVVAAGAVFFLFPHNNVVKLYAKKILILKVSPAYFSYLLRWLTSSMGWILLVGLLPLLASYFLHIKSRNKFLLIWLIVPLVIFSLKGAPLARYLLPVLPALALIAAGELHELRIRQWLKNAYCAVLIAAAVAQYGLINYGMVGLAGAAGNTCYNLERGMLTGFKDKFQPTAEKLFDVFRRQPLGCPCTRRVLFLFNIAEVQGNLSYYVDSFKMPFFVACYMQDDEAKVQHYRFDDDTWESVLLGSDYVVDKDGDQGQLASSRAEQIGNILRKLFVYRKDAFYLLTSIPAPDKSTISVYKRKKQRLCK